MSLGLRSSPSLLKMILCVVIEMNFCRVPSQLSGNTSCMQSSTILKSLICSYQQLERRNRCPETPFCFGLDRLSASLISLLPMRIADRSGSKHTRSGSLPTSFLFIRNCTIQSTKTDYLLPLYMIIVPTANPRIRQESHKMEIICSQ